MGLVHVVLEVLREVALPLLDAHCCGGGIVPEVSTLTLRA